MGQIQSTTSMPLLPTVGSSCQGWPGHKTGPIWKSTCRLVAVICMGVATADPEAKGNRRFVLLLRFHLLPCHACSLPRSQPGQKRSANLHYRG